MNLEIFVYLLCRFLGENRIYTVQCENSFTNRAHPRNWPFGLVIESRSCKDWHGDSFPQADSGRHPCGLKFVLPVDGRFTRECGSQERNAASSVVHA